MISTAQIEAAQRSVDQWEELVHDCRGVYLDLVKPSAWVEAIEYVVAVRDAADNLATAMRSRAFARADLGRLLVLRMNAVA